ncbi:GNAT family N-acetyltransferase [Dactylosporangium sp. NPDC000555]|uniref:GNAT family N-acetyltransferase n=1 Tax=Dactylosporangium sp. NPDC000555 TaxID=3154260 RepID=UPI0033217CF4
MPWTGRDDDPADPSVWSVTCFVTRPGFRRRGVSRALAVAAVPYARSRGAQAVEGLSNGHLARPRRWRGRPSCTSAPWAHSRPQASRRCPARPRAAS